MSGKRKSQNIAKGRGDRKDTGPRSARKRTDGSRKASPHAAANGEPQLSVLTDDVKSIPMIYFHLQDAGSRYAKLLEKISTEKGMLQAIEDLYLIVKAQPEYKGLNDNKWKESTEPMEILLWLLRKLGPLAKGNEWTIDTYMDGRKERFRFVVFRHFTSGGMGSSGFKYGQKMFSCDFLPYLLVRDQPLHNLIIDALALVSKINKVPLWDEDEDYSTALENLKRKSYNNPVMNQYRDMYTKGVAANYLNIIKKRRRTITKEQLSKSIFKYDDDSQRKSWIKRWLSDTFFLIMDEDNIHNYTYVPHYEGRKSPLVPFRDYKIVWSVHDEDPVHNWAGDIMEKDKAEDGHYSPVDFSITYPGKKHIPLPVGGSNYPVNLSRWMNVAIIIFRVQFRDYFYKGTLEKKEAPAMTLLEKIELAEFKQLLNER